MVRGRCGMAKYSVGDGADPGTGQAALFMKSTELGMVELHMPTSPVFVSVETAEEIRALLALVIAEARGGHQP